MSEQDAADANDPDAGGETEDVDPDSDPDADTADEESQVAAESAADEDNHAESGAGMGSLQEELAEVLGDTLTHEPENDDSPAPAALEEVEAPEGLVGGVETTTPGETARWFELLRQRVETLEDRLDSREEEVADLTSRLKRKQADFQNYKQRQKKRMREEKQRATEDLVERLLDVRDNLERALDQDEGTDIRGGVEKTLTQFDEQLQRENVERVEPDPGEEVDPQRHEALVTIAAGQPEGTVAEVHRPGYEMAGTVIRPAQVAVSDGSEVEDESVGDRRDEVTEGDT
jgi:Molecular chaperone GrpE (heat shock protein)